MPPDSFSKKGACEAIPIFSNYSYPRLPVNPYEPFLILQEMRSLAYSTPFASFWKQKSPFFLRIGSDFNEMLIENWNHPLTPPSPKRERGRGS